MLIGIAAAFVLLVVAYVVTAEIFGVSYDFDAEPFRDWVEDWGVWGPVIFIGVMAISVLFAPIPNAPIFVAAGLAWGPVVGTIYSMAGMMLGSAMAFGVARRLGRRHLPTLVGGRAASRLDDLASRMGGRLIFWARMLPAVNFDWISYIAGLTAIGFWRFFFFSFLGMLTPTVLAVVAGDSLTRRLPRDARHRRRLDRGAAPERALLLVAPAAGDRRAGVGGGSAASPPYGSGAAPNPAFPGVPGYWPELRKGRAGP